jgi:hypothetical protein
MEANRCTSTELRPARGENQAARGPVMMQAAQTRADTRYDRKVGTESLPTGSMGHWSISSNTSRVM